MLVLAILEYNNPEVRDLKDMAYKGKAKRAVD
eukprot:COSAG03_NODE_2463_length_2730_cov_10.291904_2_plen_32_part_00